MSSQHSQRSGRFVACLSIALLTSACSGSDDDDGDGSGSDGPGVTSNPNVHATGDATAGREIFRDATWGNEGFWTGALRLPQGLVAANVTPIDALELGLSVDIEALDAPTQTIVAAEALTDLTPANAPFLNDPASTALLLNRNAFLGLVPKDIDFDDVIDVFGSDQAGVTCALCHSVTDASTLATASGGSIGRRVDGRTAHELDFGRLASLAQNSRALYPLLQLSLAANGGATLGRAPTGLTETSSEAEVDAYLANPQYYPVGTFDLTFDGHGDPTRTMPVFRADLAAPWGSAGEVRYLDSFSNLLITAVLDPTNLTTPGGRGFLYDLLGDAGTEIADDYELVLDATGVVEYPYTQARRHAMAGSELAPLGVRVDEDELLDLNAYLNSIEAPAGDERNPAAIARGRHRFRESCTQCHNVDQGLFVPPTVVAMATIWPADAPAVLLEREAPLNDVLDSPGLFDDRVAVINASLRGLERGAALPVLIDLARKPAFLHDGSVGSLGELLDPARGRTAPHPFFEDDRAVRADLVEYLESLDTGSH